MLALQRGRQRVGGLLDLFGGLQDALRRLFGVDDDRIELLRGAHHRGKTTLAEARDLERGAQARLGDDWILSDSGGRAGPEQRAKRGEFRHHLGMPQRGFIHWFAATEVVGFLDAKSPALCRHAEKSPPTLWRS
jgi:hypothetical protein